MGGGSGPLGTSANFFGAFTQMGVLLSAVLSKEAAHSQSQG